MTWTSWCIEFRPDRLEILYLRSSSFEPNSYLSWPSVFFSTYCSVRVEGTVNGDNRDLEKVSSREWGIPPTVYRVTTSSFFGSLNQISTRPNHPPTVCSVFTYRRCDVGTSPHRVPRSLFRNFIHLEIPGGPIRETHLLIYPRDNLIYTWPPIFTYRTESYDFRLYSLLTPYPQNLIFVHLLYTLTCVSHF